MTTQFVPPKYSEPIYSTKIWRAYYLYLLTTNDKTVFKEICEELKMPIDFVLADDNWVSNQFATDFLEKLKEKIPDPNIAEKAGRFAASPEVLNRVEFFLMSNFVSPALYYYMAPKLHDMFNRFDAMELSTWRPGRFVYKTWPKITTEKAHPDICLNVKGTLKSTQYFFNFDRLDVEHPKCIHKGDPYCEFIISYSAKNFWLKKGRLAFGFAVSFAVITKLLWAVISPKLGGPGLINVLSFLLSGLAYSQVVLLTRHSKLKEYVTQYHEQNATKTQDLFEKNKKLDRRYEESNLLKQFSFNMARETSSRRILSFTLEEIVRRFKFGKAFTMLLSSENDYLYTVETLGLGDKTNYITELKVKYPSKGSDPHLFANILESGKTVYISDVESFKERLKPSNKAIVDSLKVNSLIVAPIQDGQSKYGLLVVGALEGDPKLTPDDRHLIENITGLLSISFKNSMILETESGLRQLFQKYVPKEVIAQMNSKNNGEAVLKPENLNICSFFVDLRGFTGMSENLPPERIVDALNIYCEFISSRIALYGGIVDKFIGDAVVGFFLDQGEVGSGARAALNAGVSIVNSLNELEEEFSRRGFNPPRLGIGVAYGPATIGNVGGRSKLNYTAIGDTVNLASRLQEVAKTCQNEAGLPKRAVMVVNDLVLTSSKIEVPHSDLGLLEIRGRVQPVRAYMVECENKLEIKVA